MTNAYIKMSERKERNKDEERMKEKEKERKRGEKQRKRRDIRVLNVSILNPFTHLKSLLFNWHRKNYYCSEK